MKRKRLEAWVNVYGSGIGTGQASKRAAMTLGKQHGALRVAVRLVECGPDEVPMPKAAAAVVRAAVKWAANASELSSAELYRAVRSMQKGRKK